MLQALDADTVLPSEHTMDCCSNEPEEGGSFSIDPAILELKDDISRLILAREKRSEEWGVLVVSLEHGDTLFTHSKNKALSPASNMKLFTTAAALHFLGPKFRYQTLLYYDGTIREGHLEGDLILFGTGDPGISERFSKNKAEMYKSFLLSLERAGVAVIDGDVVGDATYFSGPEIGPEWNLEDLNDWYTAPVSSLSINENIVTLQILPAMTPGQAPNIYSDQQGLPLPINNTARTVAGRPTAPLWLDRMTPDSEIHIYGQIQSGSPGVWRRLTVSDPALLAASELKKVLLANGIEVKGGPKSIRDRDFSTISKPQSLDSAGRSVTRAQILGQHFSPEIIEYLKVLNYESHNLIGESLLKTIGRLTGNDGSFEGGSNSIVRFLQENVKIPKRDITISDGSGLSASNQASPEAFVRLFTYLVETEQWKTFISTLPEAGQSLQRMYRTPAARNLRAKTGTIEGASALTGVVTTRDGEDLIFSIISNGLRSTRSSKRIEDLISTRLANFRRTSTSH